MASWQAHILNMMLRWRMKRTATVPIDVATVRANSDRMPPAALRVPAGMALTEMRAPCDLAFDVLHASDRPLTGLARVVLFLHGGGYFFCSPKTHRQLAIALAKAASAPCYALDYRLAPEAPFPAAVEDAIAAYRWLAAEHPSAEIVLAGDSAGGALALVTAIAARDQALRPASAVITFSPWTDLAVTGASVEDNARTCVMFKPDGIRAAAKLYLNGADPCDPRASPLYADLAGLPPLFLTVSNHETLRDDGLRLAERARAAGVNVTLTIADRLPHVWPLFVRLLPEARASLADVATFLATRTERGRAA
jgi:acetyl esterase/lipase